MMELFIQIRDGQPFEHPIFGDNFREAFPHINTDDLPSEFAKFERIEAPLIGAYEVVEGPTYQWVDGVVKDVWAVRAMTEEEKTAKVNYLSQMAYEARDNLIKFAQNKAATSTELQQQAWIDYINTLNVWVLIDPLTPNIPMPPLLNEDGTLLTTTASGSAPNVVG